jgi:uncharacterized tellurite resistance protein B-like protein|tara:strand:- start:131 stop:532 length:402 start_codon:yes stop_codon:yes gene_type:complete
MEKIDQKDLIGITALLIHAAKIDENYSEKEKKIIKDFLKKFESNVDTQKKILDGAEKLESDSNQLLNFTNIIKKNDKIDKYMIIEQLWKIIISDNNSDQYETNLMRRICGLIYFPDKLSGEIKLKLKKNDILR